MEQMIKSQTIRPSRVSMIVLGLLLLPGFIPLVSAAGMQACSSTGGTCDTYQHTDDMTPDQQDWIEGTYSFTMLDTSTIQLDLAWAVREFDRETIGMESGTIVGDTLEDTDGLDENDGAPADMIRQAFDLPSNPMDASSPTVGVKLKSEVNSAIQSALQSGFGTVTSLVTDYINEMEIDGAPVVCSTDSTTDSQEEDPSQDNNVFDPPLCFGASATVELAASKFNLVGSADLDLERAYQGLLIMGSEINTNFMLTAEPGQLAEYVIHPPSYSTISSVDDDGSLLYQMDTIPYHAGFWSVDNRLASVGAEAIEQNVEMSMIHRNSTATPTVSIEDNQTALEIHISLDVRDDTAATIQFVAGLHYIDEATMNDWGINLFEVSSMATLPVVTADGIRLAYHNGLIDLPNLTSQFPITDIVEGFGSTVAGIGTITMEELSWVSSTDDSGVIPYAGGLNYSHSTGCTEPVLAGQVLHYCLQGTEAMSENFPVYLETESQPFSLSLIDILKEYNPNEQIDDFLNEVSQADLKRVMNSGISLETTLSGKFLDSIIPSNLPPSELTVEIQLPTWLTTKDETGIITLHKTVEGTQKTNISLVGTSPYDWRNEIKNNDGHVVCYANQTTCITSEVQFDWESLNINEWSQSLSFTFALEAELGIHRIGLPSDLIPSSGETKVSMEAIPSDLIRLMIDLSSSMDEPLSSGPMSVCDNENYRSCANEVNLTATREGLTSFTKQMGELVTDIIHDAGDELEKENQFSEFDLSKFVIKTEISGIQAPDGVVSDDQAITLKLSIPEVTFTLGVDASTADLQSGNTDNIRISVVTSYLQSLFVQPMQSIGSTLVRGIQYSFISSSGLTFPAEGEQAQTYRTGVVNTTIYDDAQLSLTGPMSFTLPRGVQLVDVSSTSGNLIVTEDGSRQTVTYIIPPGEFEDEITYRIHIGWMYFLIQFWIYPAIVLFLLVMFIRRRRRKKKEKKARKARQEQGIAKMQLGDDAFADLTGFASPGLRAGETIEDMASVDQY